MALGAYAYEADHAAENDDEKLEKSVKVEKYDADHEDDHVGEKKNLKRSKQKLTPHTSYSTFSKPIVMDKNQI